MFTLHVRAWTHISQCFSAELFINGKICTQLGKQIFRMSNVIKVLLIFVPSDINIRIYEIRKANENSTNNIAYLFLY